MAGTSKRQHIVPRSYLEGFLPSGSTAFWQFDKLRPLAAPRSVLPKDAAVEKHFYSIKSSDGDWDDSAEKRLAAIESRAVPLLKALKDHRQLSQSQRLDIGYFLAAQFRRTRAASRDSSAYCEDTLASVEFREWFANAEAAELKERFGVEIADAVVQKIRAGTLPRVSEDVAKAQSIEIWMNALSRYAFEFSGWYWEITRAPKRSFFVSSDSPAFVRRYSKRFKSLSQSKGSSTEVEFYFPVNSRQLLVLSPNPRPEVSSASPSRFRELLRLQIENADRFVYAQAPCEHVANLVMEFSKTGPLSIRSED